MNIKKEIESIRDEVISLRRDFHMNPELGTQEFRTSKIVEDYLNSLGIKTQRVFQTGIVGILKGRGEGKTLLLRADMDALPIQEENDVSYASKNNGIMHACGHDGHTAMLLCAAKVLANHCDEFAGNIKFVFQPNEESSGAAEMVKEGVLDNPRVDRSFAMHLWSPIPSGTIGLSGGPTMAEMYNFKVSLMGKSCHSSAPQDGMDPIICAANIIQALQVIQTREIGPLDATCLSIGKIQGGTKTNIIADKCEFEGSLRYLYDGDDDGVQHPRKRFERIVKNIADAYRIQSTIEWKVSNYVLINDDDTAEYLKENVFSRIDGVKNIVPYHCMGGEDFSEFCLHNGIPGALAFIGIGNHEKGTDNPHHSCCFNIDEDMLTVGVEAFVRMALTYLS